jgi:hypothetical protein
VVLLAGPHVVPLATRLGRSPEYKGAVCLSLVPGEQDALVGAGLARAKEAIFDVRTAARQMASIYHFLRKKGTGGPSSSGAC